MSFTRNDAIRLLRPSVSHFSRMGNPTEEEIDAKMAEMQTKSAEEQVRMVREVMPPTVDELQEQITALENKLVRNSSSFQRPSIFYTLSENQTAYDNSNTTVEFNRVSSGRLTDLGLTLSRGIFTSNKVNNLLLVSYELLYSTGVTGICHGTIAVDINSFGRNQVQAVPNRATFVSGSSPILLNRNDSFLIRAYHTHTENIDLDASNTRLSIISL